MFLFIFIIYINCIEVFSNYTFYKVIAFSTHERELLYGIPETQGNTYFLNGITNEASTSMDIAVDSSYSQDFEQTLYKYDIEHTSITKRMQESNNGSKEKLVPKNLLQTFLNWDEILSWIENKMKENSALTKTVIAKTYEHRDIVVLKVSAEKTGKRKSVFIVAGEEGRDWLSPALLLNYINRILKTTSSPRSLLNYYDIYFIPIFNPDGFVYSKNKNRMWAKNRKVIQTPQICQNQKLAVGVNIDKNWFIEASDSRHACNSIYQGSKALSEEETQGLSYILNSIALKLLAFINLRGFGNLITLPYAYDKEIPTNHYIVMEIMKHTSAVLKMQYNKSFPVGTTANYFYNFSGNMPDWVKKKLNIPIVFTVYMQHDNFLPEESHILPLTEQLDSLLNISLTISKEIYGSLYNTQRNQCSDLFLIIVCFIVQLCEL